MWIRSMLLLSLCVMAAAAQTLQVTPLTLDRGSANIFRIILKPRAEKPIAALQWDLVVPLGLRIEPSGVVSGTASEQVGKSVRCGLKPADGVSQRLACILAGGVQALPEGAIAVVRLEAASDAPKGKMPVGLEKVVGVSPSLESISIEDTKGLVTLR